MKKQNLAWYLAGLFTLMACAMVEYKRYGLDLPTECYDKGTLLGREGKDGWPSLPFTECRPDEQKKGKCLIQKSEDFFKKDEALRMCQKALSDCQRDHQ